MESIDLQKESIDVQPSKQETKKRKREPKEESKKRKRGPKENWEDIDPEIGRHSAFWDAFFYSRRDSVNAKAREKAMAYEVAYRWNHKKDCLSFMKIKCPKVSRKEIFNRESLYMDLEKKKREREKEVRKIFKLLPSKKGIKATDGYRVKLVKSLDQLTGEALAVKVHLETHMNIKGSELLLKTVEYVIRMVDLFSKEIELPTFDWNRRRYPKECHEIPYNDVIKECNHAKNELEISKSGLALPVLDIDWCQPVAFSFDGEEKKIWLEFKEFDKGNLEEGRRSIQLDNPIVSVIGKFAVRVFKEKMEARHLYHFEFIECGYKKILDSYHFHMIIEAIEEGNLSVYETSVMCSSDGSQRQLNKFRLANREPVGTKAMAVSLFSILRSVCKTVEGVAEEKVSKLNEVLRVVRRGGMERGLAMDKLSCISTMRTEIVKDLHQIIFREHPLLFSGDCSQTKYPEYGAASKQNQPMSFASNEAVQLPV